MCHEEFEKSRLYCNDENSVDLSAIQDLEDEDVSKKSEKNFNDDSIFPDNLSKFNHTSCLAQYRLSFIDKGFDGLDDLIFFIFNF